MEDTLSSFLGSVATPELQASLMRAAGVFEKLQIEEEYLHRLNELMAIGDNRDSVLMDITNLITSVQRDTLAEFTIEVATDVSLDFCSDLLEGIHLLPDYEDEASVLALCANEEMGASEIFANLMNLVTPLSVDEVLIGLHSVNRKMIAALSMQVQVGFLLNSLEEKAAEEQGIKPYIDKLLRFVAGLVDQKLTVVRAIRDGYPVGESFTHYADMLGREIESLTVERIADELVACALVSSDGTNNPAEIIRKNLENYVADPSKAMKIDICISRIMLRLAK